MGATVRSVTVDFRAGGVSKYVADVKLMGRETRSAFDGANSSLATTDKHYQSVAKSQQTVARDMGKVGSEAKRTSRDIDGVGTSTRRLSKDLDSMSGRAHLLVDALLLIGPAAAPIGALAVPAFFGLAGAAGASVASLGATVIALQGVGDAFKALDKARIEPTAENIQAAREATEGLAPAAQKLVTHLYSMRDEWIKTRNITQQGLFPGVDAGIDKLSHRLPEVQRFLGDIASETGALFEQGATSLSGSRWDAFFTYLDQYGRPLLDDTAASIGNVAHGLGELFAATGPDQLSFTKWLVDTTESFDEWATRMQATDGFREFMDYAAAEGPKVAKAAGEIADAIIQIAEAAAPLGGPSLAAITAVSTAIANIADSDAGTPLLAVAAGLTAVARARKLMQTAGKNDFIATGYVAPLKEIPKTIPSIGQLGTVMYRAGQSSKYASEETLKARKSVGEFGKSLAPIGKGAAALTGIAVASSGVADGMGLSNTASLALMGTIAGPWGTALGAGVGVALDMKSALHDGAAAADSFDAALQAAVKSGSRQALVDTISAIGDEIDHLKEKTDAKSFWLGNPVTFLRSRKELDKLPGTLAAAKQALDDFDASGGKTGDLADLMGETVGRSGRKFRIAAGDVQAFSAQLAVLNGWLDKRDALRNYEDSLDTFGQSVKKNIRNFDITTAKGRENQAALDGVAQSVLQVANQMKSPGRRENFIHGAIGDLRDLSVKASPQAQAAIHGVVRQLRTLDTTPAKPKVDVNTKPADGKIKTTKRNLLDVGKIKTTPTLDANRKPAASGFQWLYGQMGKADKAKATPSIRVDTGNTIVEIMAVQARLNALRDRTIHLTTVTNKINAGGGGGGGAHPAGADGMTVPGPREPYGDKVLAYLAPGEEVITNRNGEADRFRRDRASGRIPRYANGGTAGGRRGSDDWTRGDFSIRDLLDGARLAGASLKELHKASTKLSKHLDDRKSRLSDLQSASGSLTSTVSDQLRPNLFPERSAFAAPLTVRGLTAASNAAGARAQEYMSILAAAKKKGLTGPAMSVVLEQGGIDALRLFATSSAADDRAFTASYNRTDALVGKAGAAAGNARYGAEIGAIAREVRTMSAELKKLNGQTSDKEHHDQRRHNEAQTARHNGGSRSHDPDAAKGNRRHRPS